MNAATLAADVVQYGPMVVTAAAAAAAVLPQGAPGSAWATVRAMIDVLAMNFGNAKNMPKT